VFRPEPARRGDLDEHLHLQVAQEMCDPSASLKGRIIAKGTVDELRVMAGGGDPNLTVVFLKLTGGSAVQEIDEIL
jgi:hypothetical protein